MYDLMLGPHARGTAVEQLHRLVEAVGLVTTVQTSIGVGDTAGVIVEAAPRLAEDHDVLSSGLIMSRIGMYRIAWGVVSHPGGSLAVLAPLPGCEGQQSSDWIRHYMREVLDPVMALSGRGHRTGGGGNGTVAEEEFARAFREAYV
ncbi:MULTISPECIES: hypothetical protein [Streptomyces]|uniref:hypothetical protein n=1 Tax=Streptomyces TaxID=1883 RepID=UPI0004BF5B5C|nr:MULTISPECIES: hypothetical protein [unclassified Streptomyces]